MIPVVMALSLLVSSIPNDGRAPAAPNLFVPHGVSLLEPENTHPGLGHSLLAQADAPATTPSRRTYKRFLIIRQDGERIEGREGVLESNHLTGKSSNGEPIDVPLKDIKTLYTAQDARVGAGALYGGLTGFAIMGCGVLALGTIPNFFSYDGTVLGSVIAVGGGTLLGAGVGALIGLGGNDWHVEPIVSPGKVYVLQLTIKA